MVHQLEGLDLESFCKLKDRRKAGLDLVLFFAGESDGPFLPSIHATDI